MIMMWLIIIMSYLFLKKSKNVNTEEFVNLAGLRLMSTQQKTISSLKQRLLEVENTLQMSCQRLSSSLNLPKHVISIFHENKLPTLLIPIDKNCNCILPAYQLLQVVYMIGTP